jgi:hypothetical protein
LLDENLGGQGSKRNFLDLAVVHDAYGMFLIQDRQEHVENGVFDFQAHRSLNWRYGALEFLGGFPSADAPAAQCLADIFNATHDGYWNLLGGEEVSPLLLLLAEV